MGPEIFIYLLIALWVDIARAAAKLKSIKYLIRPAHSARSPILYCSASPSPPACAKLVQYLKTVTQRMYA